MMIPYQLKSFQSYCWAEDENEDADKYNDEKEFDTAEDTDEDKMDDNTISADDKTRTERRFPQRPINPTKGSRIP